MNSKDYWDLSEQERAKLDYAGLQRYVDYELMRAGVLVAPPDQEEPPLAAYPELPAKIEVFGIQVGYNAVMYFKDAETAAKVAALAPFAIDYDYMSGMNEAGKVHFIKDVGEGISVIPTKVLTAAAYRTIKAQLTDYAQSKGARDAVAKERSDYDKTVTDATQGMRDDYVACCTAKREAEGIVATWDKYLTLADGDVKVAFKFFNDAMAKTGIDYTDAFSWSPEFKVAIEHLTAPIAAEPEVLPEPYDATHNGDHVDIF